MKTPNIQCIGAILRAVSEDAFTSAELAEETGLADITARRWMRELHQMGVVYIAGWEKTALGRDASPMWRFGIDKADKPRERMTTNERTARYRKKMRDARVLNLMVVRA